MEAPLLEKPPVRPRTSTSSGLDELNRVVESREQSTDQDAPQGDGNGQEAGHDQIPALDNLPKPNRALMIALAVLLVLVMAGGFVLGLLPKLQRNAELNADAQAEFDPLPAVSVQFPRASQSAGDIQLPGNVQPLQETAIYARTTGYLKRWLVDIGGHVKAGQLLAEIDSPEVDQQLMQARADLASAQANLSKSQLDLTYVETTLKRFEALIRTNGVTPQELDMHRADTAKARTAVSQAQATVASDQANVRRLEEMQSFEKVTAPFAGTITARNYDIGALITANGTAGVQPMFRIAETDVLRVWVNVPQTYATSIRPGLEASLLVREFPGQEFSAKVANTAGALDAATRTLLTEVRAPNADGRLFAGIYCTVKFHLTNPAPPLTIPVSALIENAQGTQVAVVDTSDVARFRRVEVGRDFGTEVEIMTGLSPDDRIVTNPGERLADGAKVRVVSQPQTQPQTTPAPPPRHGQATEARTD